jgi:hypothetical protein
MFLDMVTKLIIVFILSGHLNMSAPINKVFLLSRLEERSEFQQHSSIRFVSILLMSFHPIVG